jgi:glycosyltransferase involved in cell wall biosynthesis
MRRALIPRTDTSVLADELNPLMSIVINNYNYGSFLRQAIESALAQTYPHIEIVVVDDGSTDDSCDVIRSFGSKIVPVLKANEGHGSTFNAGFTASHGEIVCFLDADDIFLPDKVSRVVKSWREHPTASLIYHLMQSVDIAQRPIGKIWPAGIWCGDIRQRVERSGGWWPCPTSSGLCAARSYLSCVLPMPLEPYRMCAESYITGLAPFFGPVVGIPEPLAMLRIHGKNSFSWGPTRNREHLRRSLDRVVVEFNLLRDALDRTFHIPARIALDDNYAYHHRRWDLREDRSILRMLKAALLCPALPLAMKANEIANIILDGCSSRWPS